MKLIQDDDNYKNILQVKIQKEFKDTPHYIEISHDEEKGYEMGVYLCLGQKIHEVNKKMLKFLKTSVLLKIFIPLWSKMKKYSYI